MLYTMYNTQILALFYFAKGSDWVFKVVFLS